MILLIDNYDSFSYNLYQMIGEIEPDVKVVRNDEISVDEIRRLKPERIILSPGPGRPEDAGILIEVVKVLGKEIPISVSAWDIRQSARPLERKLLMQKSKCTESSLR